MNVLLLGATGLTGRHCLEGLLALPEVSRVTTVTRQPLDHHHPKLKAVVADFEHLESVASHFEVDALVCCLGTTLKQAGSRQRFRRVDHDYCLHAAKLGRARGAKAFLLMSAVGASRRSPVFYNRVKGQIQDAIAALGYPQFSIYQPGLLLGERQQHRRGEAALATVMPTLNRLMVGPLSAYRGIESSCVAQAMVNEVRTLDPAALKQADPQVVIRRHEDILALACAAPLVG